MYTALLSGPTDVAGWRAAARRLRLAETPPERVRWTVRGEEGLFASEALPPAGEGAFTAPKALVGVAEEALLNRAPDRFDLLYRLLWRARDEPHLIERRTDPEVERAFDYQHQVRKAEHHLHAFVRFRRVETGAANDEAYAAWIDPPHYVVEKAAPFFVRRLANMRFSIASPYVRVAWDGEALSTHPGVPSPDIPEADASEDDWRAYYAATFNPARLNTKLMAQHMPKRYWSGLPEADAISELVAKAGARAAAMVAAAPTPPTALAERLAERRAPLVAAPSACPTSLEELRAAVLACRRCPLHCDTTQAVAGEGDGGSGLMIVGEQPGDLEDLRGRPFVGPAGAVLDAALAEAGVERDHTWLTNAVKHFKHERRGKRRLHKTPDPSDIAACGDWLDIERRLVKPRVILALGATAARALTGRPIAITRERGLPVALADGATLLPTFHPAYILRLPDGASQARARETLAADLATAHAMAEAA